MPQCSRRGMLQPAPHSLSIVKRKRGHLCALACSELLACFQEVDSLVGTLFHEIPGGGLLKGKRRSALDSVSDSQSENLLTRPSLGAKFGGLRAPRGWTS